MCAPPVEWRCFTLVHCAALLIVSTSESLSAVPLTVQPESRLQGHSMKGERLLVKDDRSTRLSLQLTAPLHFLPRWAEGRRLYLPAELRSFHLCAADYSLRRSGRERAWLTIWSKDTHTHTRNTRKKEKLHICVSVITCGKREKTQASYIRMKAWHKLPTQSKLIHWLYYSFVDVSCEFSSFLCLLSNAHS